MVKTDFAKYVSQNILAMLGISCYILADTFFISLSQGSDGLTALNLVLPVYSLIFAIGSMIGTGSATRFSILRARGEEEAEKYFANALMWELIFGLMFTAVGALCPEGVIRLLGGDEHITALGTDYTRLFMLFGPAFTLNYTLTAFVRNDGAPSRAMAATLSSSFSNILLDYLFMFPLGMGMSGAALATGISPLISCTICLMHFFSKKNTVRFVPAPPSLKRLRKGCQLGVAAFVAEISSGVTVSVFNFLMLGLAGNTGVAAYGVTANFAMVASSVFNGIANGAQPLVSRAYGSAESNERRHALSGLLKMCVVTAAAIAVIFIAAVYAFTDVFVGIFNNEGSPELAALGAEGMRLYFIGFIPAGLNIVLTAFLSASERAVSAFIAAIMRGFAAIIGFAFLLSAMFGITGLWLAFPASEILTLVISTAAVIRFMRER